MPRLSRASCLFCRVLLIACGIATTEALQPRLYAQVLNPNVPNPNRSVHPAIADASPALAPNIWRFASPLFAAPDTKWNHGEGFAPNNQPDEDSGGWFSPDDGTALEIADVHTDPTWSQTWPALPMLRLTGFLRPQGSPLPTVHPLYGDVTTHMPNYVDQGAFEMFKPTSLPTTANQPILVCILARGTAPFPEDHNEVAVGWYQIYPGIFSPDGLERPELAGPRSLQNFNANRSADTVIRPYRPQDLLNASSPNYWPILAYPVQSVMRRQTTLNEQRFMQMIQAVKLLLQENSSRNPLFTGPGFQPLTAAQVESRVVVCFVGGSNGGLQAQWATLRYPHLVDGCFAQVISPSYQRLYGEHDLGHAVARLSGAGLIGATVTEHDFLDWDQYVWSEGIEAHDISYTRLFLAGQTYRPACFLVGDEDITATGTDWARVTNGSQWTESGLQTGSSPFGASSAMRFAWLIGKNACHDGSVVPVTNPYTGQPNVFSNNDIAFDLFEDVVAHHNILGSIQPPQPALTHQPRQVGQELRGLDDPQEWFLGRAGDAMPTVVPSTDPLVREDAFFTSVQPNTAGSMPGAREAMVIQGGALFVGSADGLVSKFVVDPSPGMKQRLQRTWQSPRLGHEVFAMVVANNDLVVATRRHLHKIDLTQTTPAVVGTPVLLPWEVAQPHHMAFGEVLPDHQGPEIVFASIHGGLVFCDPTSLNPFHEWPEPGIVDFRLSGGGVTILSSRNVVANVTFGTNHEATLQAVSQSIPAQLRQHGAPPEPPCQGSAFDLELMNVNWTMFGLGVPVAAISSWVGDFDGVSVRGHWLTTLDAQPVLPNYPSLVADVATCKEASSAPLGDHLLVLGTDGMLSLYDQLAQLVGQKNLTLTAQQGGGYYPFGANAHTLCVGELVANSGAYSEEVVVATNTGLMWLHVQDLAGPNATLLPATGTPTGAWASGYWLDTELALGTGQSTHVQPRTNETMASAWALARRPGTGPSGFDDDLHVLDQRGAYWKIGYAGNTRLFDVNPLVVGARGWDFVGPVSNGFPPLSSRLGVDPPGSTAAMGTDPWCPLDTVHVAFELGPPGTQFPPQLPAIQLEASGHPQTRVPRLPASRSRRLGRADTYGQGGLVVVA